MSVQTVTRFGWCMHRIEHFAVSLIMAPFWFFVGTGPISFLSSNNVTFYCPKHSSVGSSKYSITTAFLSGKQRRMMLHTPSLFLIYAP